MSGESAQHSFITSNVIAILNIQLRGKPCAVFSPNMKVYSGRSDSVRRTGLFSYPDCMVACGPAKFHDEERDVVTNPKVIIEVLSPTTESYDRGKKFMRYQQNESLRDYILIAQRYPSVELYSRRADGLWTYRAQTRIDSTMPLESIECELPLSEVYDRIEFPETDDDEPPLSIGPEV